MIKVRPSRRWVALGLIGLMPVLMGAEGCPEQENGGMGAGADKPKANDRQMACDPDWLNSLDAVVHDGEVVVSATLGVKCSEPPQRHNLSLHLDRWDWREQEWVYVNAAGVVSNKIPGRILFTKYPISGTARCPAKDRVDFRARYQISGKSMGGEQFRYPDPRYTARGRGGLKGWVTETIRVSC